MIAAMLLTATASAQVRLPNVNCAAGKDARCTFKTDLNDYGTTGEGLPFALGGFEKLGSGFVDAASNALFVPLDIALQEDNQGAVIRVDLSTGDRTMISGYDGQNRRGKGQAYTDDRGQPGEAWDLGGVRVLRPGPDGSILALVDKGLQHRTEILRIDPKTGDRTLVWASKIFSDSARDDAPGSIRTIEKNVAKLDSPALCRGGGVTSLKPANTFEVDGTNLYLFMYNNPQGTGSGLSKVPLTGGSCTWISQYFPDGSSPVGSGNTINTLLPLILGSGKIGSEVLGTNGPNGGGGQVFAINVQTGERRTVSQLNTNAPARSVGKGDMRVGYLGQMAVGDAGIATSRYEVGADSFEIGLIDPKTGARSYGIAKTGTLKTGRDSSFTVVAAVPGTSKFIIAFDMALHVWDAKTQDSFLLSQ
ncbi:hypothetical protein DFI_18305 (plasmid) [Deinococcus ficus]|uniref:Uncharacterized protein n=2 Tax=Deinococcus ficus TaxID=317577 RepID=A0A221T2M4_9DEIO|nr:hypothetical protein DFI_18305 [Deinococcus ficus]